MIPMHFRNALLRSDADCLLQMLQWHTMDPIAVQPKKNPSHKSGLCLLIRNNGVLAEPLSIDSA